MSQWYLLRNNETHGPYEEAQVREWVQAGQMGADDMICPVGADTWQKPGDFLEFSQETLAAKAAVTPGPTAAPGYTPPAAAAPAAYAPAGAAPGSSLGAWITRGWEMVKEDMGPFIGATALLILVTLVSIGICGPPLSVGMYKMLLRKYRGETVAAGDVFQGFSYFGQAWVFALIVGGASMVLVGPLAVIMGLAGQSENGQQAMAAMQMMVQGLSNILSLGIGTITFFALPYIADDRGGAIEAIKASWETVKLEFWNILLAMFVFQLIASAGIIACCVGLLLSAPVSQACIVAAYRSRFPEKNLAWGQG